MFFRNVAVSVALGWVLLDSGRAADIDKAQAGAVGEKGIRPLVSADRAALPMLAPASVEGQARIQQFKVAPGLKVSLWAAEPMLANPVAFAVDERGRVFTSETFRYRTSVLDIRHYMFMLEDDLAARSLEDRLAQIRKHFGPQGEKSLSQETELLRMIEDRDGDGKADLSTVVADGFTSPLDGIASGVLARNGQIWFTDIPSVWRFSPTNQPVAKALAAPAEPALISHPTVRLPGYRAEEIARGFGVRFSYTGHDLHGLKFGPDGRLYFSVGDRGAHLTTKEGRTIDLPDEGAVFRCDPDGSNLEVIHRGLRNPQELAFNEYGDLFSGDNDSDQGDRERWVQIVEGADSGWRVGHQHAPLGNAGMWNMERLWVPHFDGQARYVMPPIANINDGPSGLVYDYGTSLPAGLKGRFLLAYFKGTSSKSGVSSLKLRQSGAGYELVAHDEFIWNSLVPDVDLGPDGAIYFADWHEGWPKSNKGRIYRAVFPELLADPIHQEAARFLGEGMTRRSESELMGLLSHRDMRVRQEAQFELAGRGPGVAGALSRTAIDPSAPEMSRIHSLWGLGQICRTPQGAGLGAEILVLLVNLKDPSAEIRAQTAALLGEIRLAAAHNLLTGLFNDTSLRVRRHAVAAVSRLWSAGYALNPANRRNDSVAGKMMQLLAKSRLPNLAGAIAAATGAEIDPPHTALFALARSNDDMLIREAIVEFLSRTGLGSMAIAEGAIAGDPVEADRLKTVGLLALRRTGDVGVQKMLADKNPLLVLEAARAINDVPILAAQPELAAMADSERLNGLLAAFGKLRLKGIPTPADGAIRDVRADQPLPWTNAPADHLSPMLLRVVNANFREGTSQSAARLSAIATRRDLPELVRSEAVAALGTWAKPAPRDRIVGTFRPLAGRDEALARTAIQPALSELFFRSPVSIQIASAMAVSRLGMTNAVPNLAEVVRNTALPSGARAAALRSFTELEYRPAERDSLLAFAARDKTEALRLEASKLNAALNPNDAAGQLAAKLSSGSLAEQQSAFASLGDLKSEAADAILAEWLEKLMKREVANEVMLDLVDAAGKRTASVVKSRLAAYQDWKLPKDHLSPYRETLSGGNAERGRKIFYENAAVSCTRCHQIGSDGGGNAGPKLDGLATRTVPEHLLESVVFPNRQVLAGFESAVITTRSGSNYAGTVQQESATELVLNSPEDGEVRIPKADIATREKGLSGMPEGMGELLSRFELRDVMEFLGTLK